MTMTNMERCLKWVNEIHPEVETEEQLRKYLSFMSDEKRKIFEAKWGLDSSGECCDTFKELNEKLNVNNSRHLYHKALSELDFTIFKLTYASLIENYEDNLEMAFCYGTFIALTCGNYVYLENMPPLNADLSEIQSRCEKALTFFTKLERQVLVTKYGLEDAIWCKSDRKVSKILGMSLTKVLRAYDRALRKLNNSEIDINSIIFNN